MKKSKLKKLLSLLLNDVIAQHQCGFSKFNFIDLV